MADQPNIFTSSEKTETQPTPSDSPTEVKQPEQNQSGDPYSDMLKVITTPDGRQKYATVSDAINSIPHAQSHIQNLESELKEQREQAEKLQLELEKRLKSEDVLSQLAQEKQTEQPSAQFDEQKIAQLVQSQLTKVEQQKVSLHNQKEVALKLTERFGEKAEELYMQKANELGIGVDMLNDLASKSPKAVLSYFGQSVSHTPSPIESSVNTENFNTSLQQPKAKSPLLTGNMRDMAAEWERISKKVLTSN